MDEEDSSTRKFSQAYAQAGAYISFGLQFAISILLCLFVGLWVDSELGTTPLFLLLGTFFGAGAGFYNLYRGLVAEQGKKEKGKAD